MDYDWNRRQHVLQQLLEEKSERVVILQMQSQPWSKIQLDGKEQPFVVCHRCKMNKPEYLVPTIRIKNHMCFRPSSISRAHIEDLIYKKSPRVGYIPNYKGKSEVWGHFLIITVDSVPVNFAACVKCRSVVTYQSKTGTGSMTRHNCLSLNQQRRTNGPVLLTNEDVIKKLTGGDANIRQIVVKQEHIVPRLPPVDLESERVGMDDEMGLDEVVDIKPELLPQSKLNNLTIKHINLAKRSMSLLESREFIELAQTLVDLGAEYGKFDVKQVLKDDLKISITFN